MTPTFLIAFAAISAVIIVSAAAALSLSNIFHCALCLAASLVGTAALYLLLGVEFLGLVQILVYVGAVAILIVFVILLTRQRNQPVPFLVPRGRRVIFGAATAIAFVATFWVAILKTPLNEFSSNSANVLQIGFAMAGPYVIAVQVIALLLTSAMIGALILASPEKSEKEDSK